MVAAEERAMGALVAAEKGAAALAAADWAAWVKSAHIEAPSVVGESIGP